MKQEKWAAIDIVVDSAAVESIEFALGQLDSLGTETNIFHKAVSETVCVTGYFEVKPDDELLKHQLSDGLRIYGFDDDCIKSAKWHVLQNRDWLAEWKKYWRPTETGKFIVTPPWEDVSPGGKTIIRIEPNMAFGTGTHETTQLCLKAISELYDPKGSFFDVGTGTGILALAAAKLKQEHSETSSKNLAENSAAPIFACDTDLDSVNIARENALANGVSDDIQFFIGSISETSAVCDLVCANLTLDVIIPILPLLLAKTRRILVLSGILGSQKEEIEHELRNLHVTELNCEAAGEWISITVRRTRSD